VPLLSSPPLVSVVIPSYNHARFLAQTIGSVAAQTYRPLELVVVDDGSSDVSPAVIEELLSGAPLDKVLLIEQANSGAHAAIMRGVEASCGEVVAILNSDDRYHPRRVERLLPYVAGEHELAFSGVRFVDAAGNPLPAASAWPEWYRECLEQTALCPTPGYALLVHNFSVSSGNFLFRRALYDRLAGFSDHRFTHDWDFLMRSVHYSEPAFVREPLYDYRIHDVNTTETVRPLLREEASDAFGRFVALVTSEASPNPLAPCPANWPRYFPRFARSCRPAFAPGETLERLWDRRDGPACVMGSGEAP
jgi:glycosyltransferase involved in cell wall biosynthesis